MSRSTPLFAATFAFAAAACSQGAQLPAEPAPLVAQPAPVYSQPAYSQPAYPVQTYTRPAAAPQTYAYTPAPTVTSVQPRATAPAYRSPTLQAIQPTRVAALPASRPAAIVPPRPVQKAVPQPRRVVSPTPVAATRSVETPRAVSGRPPARSEMERLNPGMPRLVGEAPAAEVAIARPRAKPARARAPAPRTGNGFAIPNQPATTSYTSSMSTPPSIDYNIPHIPQEEPLWCWAAAAQQAIGWVNNGRAPAQCAIVAMAHGIDVNDCCNDREGICAKTGEIPAIAELVRKFGGQAAETATVPRDPEEVYRILLTGATLLIRLRPAPHDQAAGIRHMIVVRGIEWLRMPSGQLEATLFYNDPLGSGYRSVSFDEIEGFFEQALIVRRSS